MKILIAILFSLSLHGQDQNQNVIAKNVWIGALECAAVTEFCNQISRKPIPSIWVGIGTAVLTGIALKNFAISYGGGVGGIIMIPVLTFKIGKPKRKHYKVV